MRTIVRDFARLSLYGQPSLTQKKIRALQLAAKAPSRKGQVRAGQGARTVEIRAAEQSLARQAQSAYERTIADWKATGDKAGASVTPGHASPRSSKESRVADHKPLMSALRYVNRPRPPEASHRSRPTPSP